MVIDFPDIEQLLIDHLGLTAPVSTTVPKIRPDEFHRVERVGGSRSARVLDVPTVVVESWAVLESRALVLAEAARQAVADLAGTEPDGFTIKRVDESSGITNLLDPLTSHKRYTQSFAIYVRGK